MKKRYFIPLFLAASFFLILLNDFLHGFSARFSITLLKQEYGIYNMVILKGSAVLTSILSGFLVAFPMGYFTRQTKVLCGLALPISGIIMVFHPWEHESLHLLAFAYLEGPF